MRKNTKSHAKRDEYFQRLLLRLDEYSPRRVINYFAERFATVLHDEKIFPYKRLSDLEVETTEIKRDLKHIAFLENQFRNFSKRIDSEFDKKLRNFDYKLHEFEQKHKKIEDILRNSYNNNSEIDSLKTWVKAFSNELEKLKNDQKTPQTSAQ